ncbi:MAG: hypothetical protein ACK5HA_19240 [Planctomycetaceae bacterium]|jgi:hypothetical protein
MARRNPADRDRNLPGSHRPEPEKTVVKAAMKAGGELAVPGEQASIAGSGATVTGVGSFDPGAGNGEDNAPAGPRSFGPILWATDWRPGTVVELSRPGLRPGTLLLLAGIPAGLVAIICLWQLSKWTGAGPVLVYPATAVFALLVGAVAALWVTGVNPRRWIRLNWDLNQLEVRTLAGIKRWPFAEIRRLTKYQANGHVQLYADLSTGPVILFDSDDHGRLGLEMRHKELTPLAMELTTALEVPPSKGGLAADRFSFWEILRQSSRVAWGVLLALLAWCVVEAFWLRSNWLLAVPVWGLLLVLQVALPTVMGVACGQRWIAAQRSARMWAVGGLSLVAGVLLLATAVRFSRGETPGSSINWLALVFASAGLAVGLFGLGVLFHEHLRPSGRRDRLYGDWVSDD